jgi:hypothetical protein
MSILLIPVVLCAAYLVMVSLCVCERMTPQTNHFIRLIVAGIGGAGFWALCKAAVFGWGGSPEEMVQGCAIVALALVTGVAPKFRTECDSQRIMNSPKSVK